MRWVKGSHAVQGSKLSPSPFVEAEDAIDPTNQDLLKLFHCLLDCVADASICTAAVAEADRCLGRFLKLQRHAFTLVGNHTVDALKDAATKETKEFGEERTGGTAPVSTVQISQMHSKSIFALKRLHQHVKSRMGKLPFRARITPAGENGADTGSGMVPVVGIS